MHRVEYVDEPVVSCPLLFIKPLAVFLKRLIISHLLDDHFEYAEYSYAG